MASKQGNKTVNFGTMKKDFLENEVQQTLESLDGLKLTEPRPFFYTRLQARMEREQAVEPISALRWLGQVRVQWAAVLLLLVLNGSALWFANQSQGTESSREALLSTLASEYQLSPTTLYSEP